MTSIPMDLIIDILSRLPAKSIRRFLCVSKLWGSMLRRPYFTELFLTRSLAHPRLLLAVVRRDGEWSFFSSPQPQNTYGKSSLVVGANFHMKLKLYKCINHYIGCYVSGLIYFPRICFSREDEYESRVVCNLNTGQYAILPTLITYTPMNSFLGFDPIDKQFKVLLIASPPYDNHHILTLGTGKMRWRKIQCPLTHYPFGEGICFNNGAVFYLARKFGEGPYGIVCFDVRSEKYMFIDKEHLALGDLSYTQLLNYKGKLGVVSIKYAHDGGFPLQLCMCVLEDVEKHEWSEYVYTLRGDNKVVKVNKNLSVVGMTATGEIVLSKNKNSTNTMKPFYVFYFNPEKNSLLSVEIQGFGELHGWFNDHEVYAFVDHVEDLTFNTMKTTCAAKSISPPEQKHKSTSTSTTTNNHQVRTVANLQQDRRTFESVNKFDALCLLDDDGSTDVKI